MKRTESVTSEGAELAFDVQGAGAPLLLIAGAGGGGDVYARIAPLLADQLTVITYDRRCNGRSTGDATVELDMAQQARDVVAVLGAAGYAQGIIFGNSGGANIALQVAAGHPAQVALLVAHEPPVIGLLPDAEPLRAYVEQVYQTFLAEGAPAALQLFATSLVGFPKPGAPAASAAPVPGGPGAGPAGLGNGLGQAKDQTFFFSKEYHHITLAAPDLAAIRAAHVAAVVLVGALSTGAYYARTVPLIAEQLGCPWETVPGNHLAFLLEPAPFAQALGRVIARFSRARLVPQPAASIKA